MSVGGNSVPTKPMLIGSLPPARTGAATPLILTRAAFPLTGLSFRFEAFSLGQSWLKKFCCPDIDCQVEEDRLTYFN